MAWYTAAEYPYASMLSSGIPLKHCLSRLGKGLGVRWQGMVGEVHGDQVPCIVF